jgi:hypothetical protein
MNLHYVGHCLFVKLYLIDMMTGVVVELRPQVHISARLPVVLAEVFRGFRQSLRSHCGILP